MSLKDSLEKAGKFSPIPVPELRYLQAAAERVRARWPDVQVAGTEKEREALAQNLRGRVERDDWKETRLSFVVAAASAVLDKERRDRPDLAKTREFLYAETAVSTSETFLLGLFRAYLDSYVPKAPHSVALAAALGDARSKMSSGVRILVDAVPELLDPESGPERLAERISKMSDPYTELLRLGIRNPHGAGFMDFAHLHLTSHVRPHLSERGLIDWYIRWLRPPGKEEGRTSGAEAAIEALLHPWLDRTPEDELRSHLVETLIELYGDPRIKSGGVWAGIGEPYIAIVHRWLTREDMRFFTGVVDATQNDAMWPPRRNFWLQLYDEGLIDAAWAALSREGFEYARQHLMRQNAQNAYTRVGYQAGRPSSNTSLIIMKIGNKIMVDGCHNYRTHVFDKDDPMAPKLFEEGYDCDQIMRASPAAKPHGSARNGMEPWRRWVRDMINADVPRSGRRQPYSYVARPRPPKPRYVSRRQPATPSYSGLQAAQRGVAPSNSLQDLSSPRDIARVPSATERNGSAATGVAPSTNTAAARRDHHEVPNVGKRASAGPTSLRKTRFPNLTDRMIAYGPSAAEAILAYLEQPTDGRTRPLLSPKAREGLAWVRAIKGDPPLRLRNAIEYLLINLKTSGVDLDDLFASYATPLQKTVPVEPDAMPSQGAAALSDHELPPLPDLPQARLELLRAHAQALEEIGVGRRTFEERKAFRVAFQKLRDRSADLRPTEVAELQSVYEELRRRDKEKWK